jgi:hypothetical protein
MRQSAARGNLRPEPRVSFQEATETVIMGSQVFPNPQSIFYQQYEAVRRDEIVGILLALFLGTFGVHHFYLRRTGLGILYCFFFWTGIPSVLAGQRHGECAARRGPLSAGHAGCLPALSAD